MRTATDQTRELRGKVERLAVDDVVRDVEKALTQMRTEPLLAPGGADPKLQNLLQNAQRELIKVREIVALLSQVETKLRQLGPIADYLEQQLQQITERVTTFSELAGLGLTAEVLTHEIANVAERLLLEAKNTIALLTRRKIDVPEVLNFAERVRSSLHALRRQTEHLDPSLSHLREQREVIGLLAYSEQLQSFYQSRLRFQEANIKIAIRPEASNGKDFAIRCSRGKLTQVFDNLLLNSEYWLSHEVKQRRVKSPCITLHLNRPFVDLSDNGLGIDPAVVLQLFQPFVTTRPGGRGLGLFVTRQLMDSMNCSVNLLPDLNQDDRQYIFRLDFTGALYE